MISTGNHNIWSESPSRRDLKSPELEPAKYWTVSASVVDLNPDPHGSGTFAWIRIRNYSFGTGSSKK